MHISQSQRKVIIQDSDIDIYEGHWGHSEECKQYNPYYKQNNE